MKIVVREAKLEQDRDVIVQALQDYLTPLANHSRFEWLYENGVHGPAQTWIAVDQEHDMVFGVASAFPRRFLSRRGPLNALVFGDFCISPKYRSLGPASVLQRIMLQHAEGRVHFWYDFPSTGMLSVYRRLGFVPTHRMVRLVWPLRVDRYVRRAVSNAAIAAGVSAIGNAALSIWQDHCRIRESDIEVAIHQGCFTQEFTRLAEQIGTRLGTVLERTDAYLNWRFYQHPFIRYEVLTARRQGESLEGYCIFYQDGGDAYVTDLFLLSNSGTLSSLLDGLRRILYDRGINAINTYMMADHPWIPEIERIGFQVREASPVLVYPADADASWLREFDKDWLMMQGDRDS